MEELDLQGLLDKLRLYDLTQWERVLIGHTGTVQLLLSMFFGHPVEVRVQDQTEEGDNISRYTHLVITPYDTVACQAHSYIPLSQNRPDVLEAVRSQKLGLGQIAVSLMIPTSRRLSKIEVKDDLIKRTYDMSGNELFYQITESFPRSLFVLWDLYWNRGLSLQAMSYELGETSSNLWYAMKRLGIPRRLRMPFTPPTDLGGDPDFWRWEAGFFDGEGTMLIRYILLLMGRPRFSPWVCLSNNDKDTLDFIQKTTQVGNVSPHSSRPKGYKWVVERFYDAEAVIKAMLPYLVTKRVAAEAFLEACRLIRQPLTRETLDRILTIRDSLSSRGHHPKYKNAIMVLEELKAVGWLEKEV